MGHRRCSSWSLCHQCGPTYSDIGDTAGGLAGFYIERKTSTTGTYARIAQREAGTVWHVDSSVATGTTYCYRVQAFNNAGASGYSNEACANATVSARRLPDFNGDGKADILGGTARAWSVSGS